MKLLYSSKERKWQAMQQYWKVEGEQYYERSDDAPEMDLQDKQDHKCHPTDPDAAIIWSPPRRE